MIRTIDSAKLHRPKSKHLTPAKIGTWSAIYCAIALLLEWYGSGLLVFAWVMAGFLVFSVFLALDNNTSPLNPTTAVFAIGLLCSLAGYLSVHYFG